MSDSDGSVSLIWGPLLIGKDISVGLQNRYVSPIWAGYAVSGLYVHSTPFPGLTSF